MKIELQLYPFVVPDTVLIKSFPGRRQDGLKIIDRIPLENLNRETIDGLIEEFKNNVYKKAGII